MTPMTCRTCCADADRCRMTHSVAALPDWDQMHYCSLWPVTSAEMMTMHCVDLRLDSMEYRLQCSLPTCQTSHPAWQLTAEAVVVALPQQSHFSLIYSDAVVVVEVSLSCCQNVTVAWLTCSDDWWLHQLAKQPQTAGETSVLAEWRLPQVGHPAKE